MDYFDDSVNGWNYDICINVAHLSLVPFLLLCTLGFGTASGIGDIQGGGVFDFDGVGGGYSAGGGSGSIGDEPLEVP